MVPEQRILPGGGLSKPVTKTRSRHISRGPGLDKALPVPGDVFVDLACAVADGAACIDAVGQLCGDRENVFGAKASTTTMWRLIDQRIDAALRPGLARADINTFRYRVLHVAARVTRGARQTRLPIDATRRWVAQMANAWRAIRTAFL